MRNTRCERAFTIAEVLIALAIMGLLLTALAVALNASVINYNENRDIFTTTKNAQQALSRITTQLRTATAVDTDSPANECALITTQGDDITYRFSSSENKLYLIDNATTSTYTLCDNVTAMTFTKNTATQDEVTYVKSVQISMTIVNGNARQTIPAAAVIRRNLN